MFDLRDLTKREDFQNCILPKFKESVINAINNYQGNEKNKGLIDGSYIIRKAGEDVGVVAVIPLISYDLNFKLDQAVTYEDAIELNDNYVMVEGWESVNKMKDLATLKKLVENDKVTTSTDGTEFSNTKIAGVPSNQMSIFDTYSKMDEMLKKMIKKNPEYAKQLFNDMYEQFQRQNKVNEVFNGNSEAVKNAWSAINLYEEIMLLQKPCIRCKGEFNKLKASKKTNKDKQHDYAFEKAMEVFRGTPEKLFGILQSFSAFRRPIVN
jgi:hypothetical protein